MSKSGIVLTDITWNGSTFEGKDETGGCVEASGTYHQGLCHNRDGFFAGTLRQGPENWVGKSVSIHVRGDTGLLELKEPV